MLASVCLAPTSMLAPACGARAAAEARTAVSMIASNSRSDADLTQLAADNPDLKRQLDARTARISLPLLAAGAIGGSAISPSASNPLVEPIQEFAAETARKRVVDARAEATMAKYYPGALGSLTMDRKVSAVLERRGYNTENTLFATSTCPDEVNSKPGELIDLFKNRWGENFALGGLAGVPFTGRAGFSAYAHHVPTDGKMFILFAPHVGVEFDGKVGQLRRVNQEEVSTACGAAVGAFKAIMKEREKALAAVGKSEVKYEGVSDGVSDYFDAQIAFIKLKLRTRLEKVMDAPDAQAYVSYQMYALVREFFVDEILTAPGFFDFAEEVTVLGGIMVNRGKGGDRFMPLMMQTRTPKDGSIVDLYEETFGPTPDLEKSFEGTLTNKDIFDYLLDKFQLSDARQALK